MRSNPQFITYPFFTYSLNAYFPSYYMTVRVIPPIPSTQPNIDTAGLKTQRPNPVISTHPSASCLFRFTFRKLRAVSFLTHS